MQLTCRFDNFTDQSTIWYSFKHKLCKFPNANQEILPGIKWGNYGQLFTPAFWKFQYLLADFTNDKYEHRLSNNIIEEIIFCLLGGYGIPSEMGVLAFKRLKEDVLYTEKIKFNKIFSALNKPFEIENGKKVHYRFANQKSKYIYSFLTKNEHHPISTHCDLEFRNSLLNIEGIGLKTASWITRNWLRSNRVAILDVHLVRAGILTGFFKENINLKSDYYKLEKKYLNFCFALDVLASDLDAVIWNYMKNYNRLAIKQLKS
jgi:N-glycosylase/DNA lyase